MFRKCLLGSLILHCLIIAGLSLVGPVNLIPQSEPGYFLLAEVAPSREPGVASALRPDRPGAAGADAAKGKPVTARPPSQSLASSNYAVNEAQPAERPEMAPAVNQAAREGAGTDPFPAAPEIETASVGPAGSGDGRGEGSTAGTAGLFPLSAAMAPVATLTPARPPVKVYHKEPLYPSLARRNNWEGSSLLLLEITAEGRVGEVTVLKSSGYEVLDRAAIQAAKKWRYQPAQRDGAAVDWNIRIPITFVLEDGK